MEASIPWAIILQQDSLAIHPAYGDTVPTIPTGFESIRLVACVTSGGDGTGSPDSAPDNFSGFQVDGNAQATLDNFVIVPLDLLNSSGAAMPDRVPDMPGTGQVFDISLIERRTFLQRPPIRGIPFSIAAIDITQGVVSPEEGRKLRFRIAHEPQLSAIELEGRSAEIAASIYDVRGQLRKILYEEIRVPLVDLADFSGNEWDGRDFSGQMVPGGIYVLRVTFGGGQSKAQRSFAVIR